jgi:hypothetical protein
VVYFVGFFAILGYFAGFPLVTSVTLKLKVKVKFFGIDSGLLKRLQIWALVAKGHKNTIAPLIFENLGHYFFWFWANYIMGHFSGYFEGASTFLTPKFMSQKSLGPLEISLEMAHYVVCPQKDNIPHFQNQR